MGEWVGEGAADTQEATEEAGVARSVSTEAAPARRAPRCAVGATCVHVTHKTHRWSRWEAASVLSVALRPGLVRSALGNVARGRGASHGHSVPGRRRLRGTACSSVRGAAVGAVEGPPNKGHPSL